MLAMAMALATPFAIAEATSGDRTDPVRNVPLACELVSTPGMPARANRNVFHAANVCGIVGTDVELQSRTDLAGQVHDYAFVGTMGAGFRIFDVTDPAHPSHAGGYIDSGWENDVQVRGDIVVATFDGVNGEDSSASTCLKTRYPEANGQGVDIYRLDFNELTATFETNLLTCVANPPGGAHNATLHTSGQWLGIRTAAPTGRSTSSICAMSSRARRFTATGCIDASKRNDPTRCPAAASFTCVTMTRPDGSSAANLWRPHDVHFSRDGRTMYVAAINSTWIVDVRERPCRPGAFDRRSSRTSRSPAAQDNPHNISISHQADVSSDGKILVISDERGGGLTETRCQEQPNGLIGGLHFWALAPDHRRARNAGCVAGEPGQARLVLQPEPEPRSSTRCSESSTCCHATERGCTVHVFRLGGNGSVSPGPIARGLRRRLAACRIASSRLRITAPASGVISFAGRPSSTDGIAEDSRTTWGNTLGWNVMPGADTWSAKEYKGDDLRGRHASRLRRLRVQRLGAFAGRALGPAPSPASRR